MEYFKQVTVGLIMGLASSAMGQHLRYRMHCPILTLRKIIVDNKVI